jgi:hypothetical protein
MEQTTARDLKSSRHWLAGGGFPSDFPAQMAEAQKLAREWKRKSVARMYQIRGRHSAMTLLWFRRLFFVTDRVLAAGLTRRASHRKSTTG